jgi:hypothetical protein
MHKNVTKCNETLNKWCKNKHGASKIIDTFETYHGFAKTIGAKALDETCSQKEEEASTHTKCVQPLRAHASSFKCRLRGESIMDLAR